MRIIIESTIRTVGIRPKGAFGGEIECRVWEGHTESGIAVQVLIPRIAVHKSQDASQFEAELQEQHAPSSDEMAFPLRMVL